MGKHFIGLLQPKQLDFLDFYRPKQKSVGESFSGMVSSCSWHQEFKVCFVSLPDHFRSSYSGNPARNAPAKRNASCRIGSGVDLKLYVVRLSRRNRHTPLFCGHYFLFLPLFGRLEYDFLRTTHPILWALFFNFAPV